MEAHIATPTRIRSLSSPLPVGLLGDDRLARLVSEGNERAFGALYGRFHQPLYRYCHSMLRHEADAQDALQSTFASALVALRRGQRNAPVRPWLFRIAHNESISLLRKRRPTGELSETLEAPTLSVEAAADERQRLSQLVADLQELPDRQRGALVMRELSGLSHEELAQALGISVGAAKQTVFEARRALAEFEEGRAMACDQIQRVISEGDRRALRGRRVRAHLRECSSCSAFASAIPRRRTALLALSPAIPAATAAGLFTRVTGANSAHHGSGGLLAGSASKGVGGVGAAISSKALVTGVAIVATAAAGTAGIVKVVGSSGHASATRASQRVLTTGKAGSSASSTGSLRSGSNSSGASSVGLATAGQNKNPVRGAGGGTHGGSPAGAHGAGVSSIAPHSSTPASASTGVTSVGQGNGTSQSGSATNPNAHGGNPNAGGTNSGSGSSNPNAHGGNPNAQSGKSNGAGSSNAHGANPNAAGGHSGAGSSNPNAGGGNPNAGGDNPNAGGGNPNAAGGNPNAGGTNASGGSINAHGGNVNAGGANSHGHSHG